MIHCSADNGVKYIFVEDSCVREQDLLAMLPREKAEGACCITFAAANMLPPGIVRHLYQFQQELSCRVYVCRRYLYSYLSKLGIQCRYLRSTVPDSVSLNTFEELEEAALHTFLERIHQCYGVDFTGYHHGSIRRRLKISMQHLGLRHWETFVHKVLTDNRIFEHLFLDFSINTTDFFRDPAVFADVRQRILPILAEHPRIRIWCAGCSNGKEVYSLAIMLKEEGLLDRAQIYGTDINPFVVQEARNGLYAAGTLASDTQNYGLAGGRGSFTDYLSHDGQYVVIAPELKKNILFFQHSLLDDNLHKDFHLILCRNVLIYFNTDLQERVLRHLYNAMDQQGFLVLGRCEGLLRNNGFSLFNKYDEGSHFYRRVQNQPIG